MADEHDPRRDDQAGAEQRAQRGPEAKDNQKPGRDADEESDLEGLGQAGTAKRTGGIAENQGGGIEDAIGGGQSGQGGG